MEKAIELVHFQLTKNCNLRCWFCGQWGKKGFFSDAYGKAMSFEDWKRVAVELADYRNKTGNAPDIMLWGGEPLLYPHFEELVSFLKENEFELGIVTNGTMIDKHIKTLKNCFKKIYVSIDGNEEIHDKIRGKGVFEKVGKNLKLLEGSDAYITIMSVISKDNLCILKTLPDELCKLNCNEIILQEMIWLSEGEGEEYSKWLYENFSKQAQFIDSWISNDISLPDKDKILKEIKSKSYPKKITYLPHKAEGVCRSSYKHLHIAWNGEVMYCTDFYDFSAGNVMENNVIDIFENDLSEKFRNEIKNCPTCRHCSWKNSDTFKLTT